MLTKSEQKHHGPRGGPDGIRNGSFENSSDGTVIAHEGLEDLKTASDEKDPFAILSAQFVIRTHQASIRDLECTICHTDTQNFPLKIHIKKIPEKSQIASQKLTRSSSKKNPGISRFIFFYVDSERESLFEIFPLKIHIQ